MKKIKDLTIKVTYRVGLSDVEVPDKVYDELAKAYEEVGYPRTHAYDRHEYMPPVEKKPTSKANVCITNMCKDRGFSNRAKIELVAKFLYSKGYKQLPNLSHQYKIIHSQYKNDFKKFLVEQVKQRKDE